MRWLLLAGLLSVPATGWATADICQVDSKCRAYSSSGAQFFQGHDYEKALGQFEHAYATRPEPRLLVNIGRCQHRLGRPEDAIISYERFRQEQPNPDATTKALLDRYLSEARVAKEAASSKSPGQNPAVSAAPSSEPASKSARPFYKTWWFWTATGATVGAVALGIGLGVGLRPSHPYKEIIWQPF